MDAYYASKMIKGYIFTLHDINPDKPYVSMKGTLDRPRAIEQPGEVGWWSHLSGRYRNAKEQREYIRSGCIDRKLPERR